MKSIPNDGFNIHFQFGTKYNQLDNHLPEDSLISIVIKTIYHGEPEKMEEY